MTSEGISNSNAVVGVKTIWSMYNDNTWRQSNRFGAVGIIIAGLLTIVTTVLTNGNLSTVFMLAYLGVVTIMAVLYSKKVYDREIRKESEMK